MGITEEQTSTINALS